MVNFNGLDGGCGGGAPRGGASVTAGVGSQGLSGGFEAITESGNGGGGQSTRPTTAGGGAGYAVGTINFGGGGGAASVNITTVSINGGGTGGQGDGQSGTLTSYLLPTPGQNGTGGGGGAGGPAQAGARGGDGLVVIIIPLNALSTTLYTTANLYPASNNTYSIGSLTQRFFSIYTSNMFTGTNSWYSQDFDLCDNVISQYHVSFPNGGLSVVNPSAATSSLIPGSMQSETVVVAAGNPVDGRTPLQFSVDGTVWNNLPDTVSMGLGTDVAFDGKNTWVAVGPSNAMTSTNGNKWAPNPSYTGLITGGGITAVCYAYSNQTWYSIGTDPCGLHTIIKSQYGTDNWKYCVTDPTSSYFGATSNLGGNCGGSSIATDGGGMIVAGGVSSDASDGSGNPLQSCIQYAYTNNDAKWYNSTLFQTGANIAGGCGCVAYNGEYWLATANGAVLSSRDGLVWNYASKVLYAPTQPANEISVEWNGQYWLLGVQSGLVMRSPDGYSWMVMEPKLNQVMRSIGWNGLRWLQGGTAAGEGATSIHSLESTDTEWKRSQSYSDTGSEVRDLFSNVYNFANRTLLPNSPLLPPSAIIAGVPAIVSPPLNVGNVGDYYSSPATATTPRNEWGPKFEDVNYASGGSMNFLGSTDLIFAPGTYTQSGSSNYDIGTGPFAFNWWIYAPGLGTAGLNNSEPSGTIFGMRGNDGASGEGRFSVDISQGDGFYLKTPDGNAQLTSNILKDRWYYCALFRQSNSGNIVFSIGNKPENDEVLVYETTDVGLSTTVIGNSDQVVQIGYNLDGDVTACLNGVFLTDFRWITGTPPLDVSALPSTSLSNVVGTQLLFNLSTPGVWVDSASNTPLADTPAIWSGLNPYSSMTLSWGAIRPRNNFAFKGYGDPYASSNLNIWGTAISGDRYVDTRNKLNYKYTGSAWIV